ncbi:MAG: hypothetical protein ACE10H_08335, partial [Candidatus Binatia bacterium]
IAVSKKEEHLIKRLCKELKISTKSGLIRAALEALDRKTKEERLRREIQESVRRCAAADKKENRELFSAGVARRISGD